jgi:hypothetical protein
MTQAILARSNATGRARMAQAITACTQEMQLAMPEWLKPFWHSNFVT